MIILDESRLTNETLSMIGQDYGMKISSVTNIDDVVERFKFDIDEFKEKLVSAIINGIRIELKLK